MEEKRRKIYTKDQVFKKAGEYCAYQERCQQEVRDKIYSWGLHSADVEAVIAQLISDGFINEERFARTFAGGKFRIKKWGRVKIMNELKAKKITEYCIRKAMEEISEKEYLKALKAIIDKKTKEFKEANTFKKAHKIAVYCISRGFESELVWDVLK
ncbi:MAG: regulatory protein RecX, partial [Bacteroidales bacterium]